jgi:hypothetical protein
MLVGHIAVGLAAKRLEPQLSLGTLVLAALLADVLWGVFLRTGLEQVAFTSGRGAAKYYIATKGRGAIVSRRTACGRHYSGPRSASATRREPDGCSPRPSSATGCWTSSATGPIRRSRLASTRVWAWACGPPSPQRRRRGQGLAHGASALRARDAYAKPHRIDRLPGDAPAPDTRLVQQHRRAPARGSRDSPPWKPGLLHDVIAWAYGLEQLRSTRPRL